MDVDWQALTDDAFLGGRLAVYQPVKGYRAGVDAVVLAASVATPERDHAKFLDIGAGAGVAGLCLAARLTGARVTLFEREAAMAGIAALNINRNGMQGRVALVTGDVAAPADSFNGEDFKPESFDAAIANPPFHEVARGTSSPEPLKDAAHAMPPGTIDDWVRFAARMLKPRGMLTMIHKAASLDEILRAYDRRFGSIIITPVHAFAGANAIRVLVRGTKFSKGPLCLSPPLILHEAQGRFTPHIEAVLREGASLDLYAETG